MIFNKANRLRMQSCIRNRESLSMRKTFLSAALAGTALTLSACSQEADEPVVENETMDEAVDEMAAESDSTAVLDASTATEDELAAIEGVSPELATAIVGGQPYANVIDLNTVLMRMVSEEEAAAIRERVFVPVNLNNTTSEELALIPGIDDRMIHEFEEYVPYEDMAEFDREMGKYIEADEIARYRQYVTLNAE